MNQTQLKYARERASSIRKRREEVLKDKHTTPSIKLSTDDKLKALKAGAFKVSKATPASLWYNSVTFTDEVVGGLNQKAFDAEKAALDVAYNRLIDELVLGDHEEALRLLRAFEAE